MKALEFSLMNGWRNIDDPMSEWREDVDEEEWLKENGYYTWADTVGETGIGWTLELHYVDDKAKIAPIYPYVVNLSNACQGVYVFCPDFISAGELMCRYAPLVIASQFSGAVEDLASRLEDERNRTERKKNRERQKLNRLLHSRINPTPTR